ncbi:MAG: hypothetical protein ABFE07_28755 [Armatimonadia bacterium]
MERSVVTSYKAHRSCRMHDAWPKIQALIMDMAPWDSKVSEVYEVARGAHDGLLRLWDQYHPDRKRRRRK